MQTVKYRMLQYANDETVKIVHHSTIEIHQKYGIILYGSSKHIAKAMF